MNTKVEDLETAHVKSSAESFPNNPETQEEIKQLCNEIRQINKHKDSLTDDLIIKVALEVTRDLLRGKIQ